MISSSLRLIVVDVDGCLTPGEGREWNWGALQAIGAINHQARTDPGIPAITLCTGRPQPYVEVLMQAIAGFVPAIYENGCGLYQPDGYRFLEHPAITPATQEAIAAARKVLHQQIILTGKGYFQPGKDASLSIYPLPGTSVPTLHQAVRDALGELLEMLYTQASVTCVDVTPAGVNKGEGVRWLADLTHIPLEQIGGIGDSASDLTFLTRIGTAAAPANAAAEVKAAVGYVSPFTDGDGVVDSIRHWLV